MKILLLFGLSLLLAGCAVRYDTGSAGGAGSGSTGSGGAGINPSLSPQGPIFPHAADWRNPTVHGIYVKNNGKALCQQCHGTNFEGGAGPACSTCHTVYPHPVTWIQDHKLTIRANGTTLGCATQCHGANLRGGLSGRDCAECHTKYPHEEDWINGHRNVAWETIKPQIIGDLDVTLTGELPVENCTDTCHQVTDSPSRACWSCHSQNKHPANWTEPTEHAKRFTEQKPISDPTHNATCKVCHGEDYGSDASPVACTDCHEGVLSHIGDWRNPSNHGNRYRTLKAADKTDCFECHEDPIPFFDADYPTVEDRAVAENEETSPPMCYKCHAAFPHIAYKHRDRRTGRTFLLPWTNSIAHVTLIMNNKVLLPRGRGGLDDPILVESLRDTCAKEGGCHSGGRGSSAKGAKVSAACTQVCHRNDEPTPW